MVSLYFRLFLLLLLLLTAVGKFVARRPLMTTQAELYFGMCQGDILLMFLCRCSRPAVWGVNKARGALGGSAPALSSKQLDQFRSKPTCLCEKAV